MTSLDLALLAVHSLIAYSWILFPLSLGLLGKRTNHPRWTGVKGGPEPRVAVILSAYNEEEHIRDRVRNLLSVDYPSGGWCAYVGVDGSSDHTAREAGAAAAGYENITVLNFTVNRGKVAVLKDLIARACAAAPPPDILIFTDANTTFHPDAVLKLCAPFSDPAVGGVCGKLLFVGSEGGETEENVYWRLENWLKARESALDSCLGANGAIYAIRSTLFWSDIPSNTIIDDFVIGMKIREQGYRFVYEPAAVAVEYLPKQIMDEWKRRVRIGAGDFQALRTCGGCLKPSFGTFAWLFFSHKVMRWFTPHLMIAGFLLAAIATALTGSALGVFILTLYAALGAAALLGRISVGRGGRAVRMLRGVQYLLAMQAAIFMGFIRFCRGNLEGRWQRTTRS